MLLFHYVVSPPTVLGKPQPIKRDGNSSVLLGNCGRNVGGFLGFAVKVNVVSKHFSPFNQRKKLINKPRVIESFGGERFVLYASDHGRGDGINELFLRGRRSAFIPPKRLRVASSCWFSLDKRELPEFDANSLGLFFPKRFGGKQNLPVFTGVLGGRNVHRTQSTNFLTLGRAFSEFNPKRDLSGGSLADICSNDVDLRMRLAINVDGHSPGYCDLRQLKPRSRPDLGLSLNGVDAILRSFCLLLGNGKLSCGVGARFCGVSPRLTGSDSQDVSLGGHFLELIPEHYSGSGNSKECKADENGIKSRPSQRKTLEFSKLFALAIAGCFFGWLASDVLLDNGRLGGRFEHLLWGWRGVGISERERLLLVALGLVIVAVCWLHFFLIVTRKDLTDAILCNTVNLMANVVSAEKQSAIIAALAEGSSIRSIERITGVHRDTIMRLGVKVGQGCTKLMDSKMQDLDCNYLQFDELWGFIGKKERHCSVDDNPTLGDVWTFCAIDSETKLVPSFKVGKRTHATTTEFVQDVARRMRHRVQVSSDAMHLYVEAMELAFGSDVDYGQCVKVYAHDAAQHPERKYSAPHFASAYRRPITGNPEMELVSTSHVERLNATTRLHMRRLTRLTLAFSKKLENFEAAVGLHFAYYNFVKRHNTLRCTPAMAAGVERDFWSVGDLVEAAA